ncbi:MAG: hypothetical protein HGA85_09190, partial [Nanoarchaeota archaeon]|nr:hypothetical protein [Nanoarchaeota archaeon]
EKSNSIASRVDTMSKFVGDFEEDLLRELFIGGYRSLISMNSYLSDSEGFVSDFDIIYQEILVNGTANGTEMDLMTQEGVGADIKSWLGRINEKATELNILVGVEVDHVHVVQISPWEVALVFNATINISDTKGLASWNFQKEYIRNISIQGLEDPLYTVNSDGRVTNLINITPSTDFVNDTTEDSSVLLSHMTNSYYIESADAPSYLMRFAGNLSPSPFGIESLVDVNFLLAQGIEDTGNSIVDYLYFSNLSTSLYCNITGLPDWARVDGDHLDDYEIVKLNYTTC